MPCSKSTAYCASSALQLKPSSGDTCLCKKRLLLEQDLLSCIARLIDYQEAAYSSHMQQAADMVHPGLRIKL